MAPTITLRTVTAAGALDKYLPEYESLDLSPVFCEAGTVTFGYPENGVNYTLLKEDLEIAVLMDGVEIGQLRCIVEQIGGEDADEAQDGTITKFTCRTLLSLLDKAVVYPKNWPSQAPATHDFAGTTPGAVLDTLLEKAQARGALPLITWDFSVGLDSRGTSWTSVTDFFDISFDAGTTYTEVISTMVAQGLIEVRMNKRVLQAYVVDSLGTDRSVGIAPLRFTKGRDIRDSPRKISTREIATSVLMGGSDAVFGERSTPPTGLWGRRESYYSANNVKQSALLSWIGLWVLGQKNRPMMEITHGLLFQEAGNPRPITNFDVGDWALSDVGKGWERHRIKQWVISVDNAGEVTGSVVLNDLFSEQAKKLSDKLDRLNNGTASPGSSEEKDDGKTPAIPTGLSLDTEYYMDYNVSRAAVTADWDPVSQNSDGSTLINLSGYRARWKYQGEMLYRGRATLASDETNWTFVGVANDRTVEVEVQAFNKYGRSSPWAGPVSVTTAHDTVAPEKPAPPEVVSRVGALRITWTGLDASGNEQVADFAGVEIHVGPNGTFTPDASTRKDFLYTRSFASVSITEGLTYGTEYWVRLVAIDTNGNRSAPSDETSTSHAVLSPVLSVEIGTGQIGLNNTRFSDIGNLVEDGSFENVSLRTTRQLAMAGKRFFFDNTTASNGYWSIGCSGLLGGFDELVLQAGLPVKPGERIFGAADFKISSDTNSVAELSVSVRWRDRDGVMIPPSTGGDQEPLTRVFGMGLPFDNTWKTRIASSSRVAPAGAASFDLILLDKVHSTGTIWIDAIEVRRQIDSLMIGTAVVQAAHIGLLQVNDAHMANVSIGKLIAGNLQADMTVSARIKTANTGARVELNSAGFGAWNSSNVRTVDISSATGSVSILGQLISGTSGRRIEFNPGNSGEVRFYPTSGTNYASIGSVSETNAGVAVNLSSGQYESNGSTTTGRLWVSADPFASIKLGQVSSVDGDTNGGELWMGNTGITLRHKYYTDSTPGGSIYVGPSVRISQGNSNGNANIQLANGVLTYNGRWPNFVYPLSTDGLFTGTQSVGTSTSFSISYGPTMASALVPIVTAHATNFGTGTPTVWGISASSTTGFTVSWNNSQGMRLNFWCYRI